MAYVEIKDFKNGLDTRRPAIVGEPGSLMECINAHITRGGDVESRKSFEEDFSLPEGTFGMHGGNNKLYVFGSDAAPTNLPGHIVYQRLQHPAGGVDMTALLSAENNDGQIYAIAEFEDGSVYHYYDGAHVTDMDTKAGTIADDESVATYFADKIDGVSAFLSNSSGSAVTVTAAVPGTSFTITTSETGTGTLTVTQIQANLAAVAEVRATASFTVTGGFAVGTNVIPVINAGATALIAAPVAYVLDNAGTALACVIAINQGTDTHGYTASSVGAIVSIRGPAGEGAAANGRVLTVTPGGLVTVGSVNNFSGGVTAVAAKPQIERIAIGGVYDDANEYTITLDSVDYTVTGLSSGMPRITRTFKDKQYTGVRALLIFSAIEDPTAVTTGTGIGTINISSQDQGSQRLTALGIYQNLFAAFTRDTVQTWQMDADPVNNSFRQLLQNTGTRSPRAVLGYGNSDLMYLADTGIRSLRARDSSNAAFVDDIGTRIDTDVIAYLETLTDAQVEAACAVTDPRDGRAWIAVGNRIYVFSYFPGSKVSAWSYFSPGFDVEALAVASRRIYARSGDTVYVYGGTTGQTYPEEGAQEVRLRLPFIDADRLSGGKQLLGIDIICSGEWTIEMLLDPNDETKKSEPLIVSGSTTLLNRIPLMGLSTHFAPLLTSEKGGRLTLSSVVVHFEDTETD